MAQENKSKPRLLVVEDDYENQNILEIFLKRKFDIKICDSSDTFYKMIEQNEFDIILMDISLRGKKDGLQLTKELRETEKYKSVPIVALSAHAFQKDKENAYKAGVDMFLTKPIQNEVLMDTLVKVYSEKSK